MNSITAEESGNERYREVLLYKLISYCRLKIMNIKDSPIE